MLSRQQCRAEDAGIVAECGARDLDMAVGVGDDLRPGRGPDEVDPRIAQGADHAAADDHDLRAEDIDQPAQAQPQVMGGSCRRPSGDGVLGGDRLGQVSALEPAPLAGHLLAEHAWAIPFRIALMTRRWMAVLLARASMQPLAPQPHRGPPALTIVWPISPALPVEPVTISPPRMMQPPIPVPTNAAIMSR